MLVAVPGLKEETVLVPWSRTVIIGGILNDFEALQIASIQEGPVNGIICQLLAYSGSLPALKWARRVEHHITDKDAESDTDANKRRRLEPLPWGKRTFALAARSGCIRVVKWLHKQKCPFDELSCAYAAAGGHIELLKWLHEKYCPWDLRTMTWAASSGHLEVMKWLRERGCPGGTASCKHAARNGHLDVLKWLREHKYLNPCDEETTCFAARGGHLDVLKYLRAQNCLLHESAPYVLAEKGHLDVIK